MTPRFFTAPDGLRLAYRDEGSGQPVLCLAGLTRNASDFDYLAPHLLPHVRLIRPDYRGRGASAHDPEPMHYSVPVEAKDALALLDHLGLEQAAVIGTSRGGLIAMFLAATAKARLSGVLLNDVGPVIEPAGLERIFTYLGRRPAARTHAEAAARLAATPGFANVPQARWLEEARHLFAETPEGLALRYDPELRKPFLAAFEGEQPDLWPLFDALAGLPLALIRGANSELLSPATAAEMRRRRPDMIFAEVPDRAHIPFLDEPESLGAIRAFLELTA